MYVPQIVLMIVALIAILLWFLGGIQQTEAKDDRPSLPAILLSSWIIAGLLFGPNFFVLRAAGIFDITIERAIFSAIFFFLVAGLFTGRVSFRDNTTLEMVMGVFAMGCVLSMLRSGFVTVSPIFVSPWFIFISGYLFPFIVFVFAKNYITREKDVRLILQTLFYLGIYLSITAFFEYTNIRQFIFPRYINDPEIGIHFDRARGPLLNSAFNGVGILIGLISGLHLLQDKKGFAKVFHQAGLLLFFPAVFFTLTRSVYVGLLISLIIFLGWYKTSYSKWKLISLPLVFVLILGIAASPRLVSTERREGGVLQVEEVTIRMVLFKRSFYMFLQQPLTGVGLGQFSPTSIRSYKGPVASIEVDAPATLQHSHLMGLATELGIPGLLAYLAMIIMIMRRLKQLAGKMPETGIMGNNLRITIFAIWCVYLGNNLFVEPATNIFINVVPFLFAGLADGLYTRSMHVDDRMRSLQPDLASRQPSMRLTTGHV